MKNLKGFNGLVFFLLMITVRANASGSYTMIVALDGSGDYTSIQSAIDASKSFPDDRISIFIKNGVYKEKVRVPAWNNKLSLIGESVEHTIISFDDDFNRINQGLSGSSLEGLCQGCLPEVLDG